MNEGTSTALATIESLNPVDIFQANGIDPILAKIREEVEKIVPDITTAKGRKEIASMAHKVAKSKTLLDDMGKQLADDLNAKLKPINAERKKARDALDALKAEIRQPLTDWEEEEEGKKAVILEKIEQLRFLGEERPCGDVLDAKTYKEHLAIVEDIVLDEVFGDYITEAAKVKDESIRHLKKFVESRTAYEKDQVELQELKKAQEIREKEEREKTIADEAAEKARLKAEDDARLTRQATAEKEKQAREKIEAEKQAEADARKAAEEKAAQAEREKIAAEERAKVEKETAEKQAKAEKAASAKREKEAADSAKQAEIDRQKEADRLATEATEKREANKRHVSKIRKQAKEGLMKGGLSEALAREIILAIHNDEIPNVSINY